MLFDPGSQTSFVRQSVIDELGLDGKSVKIVVSGFSGGATKSTLRKRIVFTVEPADKSGQPQCIEALTTPVICRPAEAVDIHPTRWAHLRNIAFPKKILREDQEIDVLIGLDFYYSFVTIDTSTIQELVKMCKETFPVASSEILRNTYVDDFASGRGNVQETLRLQQSAAELDKVVKQFL